MKRNMIDAILDKSARIALLVLLQNGNHQITTKEFAEVTGVTPRSAQRDFHDAYNVQIRLAELLKKYNNPEPAEKIYNVTDVSAMLGLNPFHVRLLARTMPVGHRNGNGWRFTEADIETIKNRPGKRK